MEFELWHSERHDDTEGEVDVRTPKPFPLGNILLVLSLVLPSLMAAASMSYNQNLMQSQASTNTIIVSNGLLDLQSCRAIREIFGWAAALFFVIEAVVTIFSCGIGLKNLRVKDLSIGTAAMIFATGVLVFVIPSCFILEVSCNFYADVDGGAPSAGKDALSLILVPTLAVAAGYFTALSACVLAKWRMVRKTS